MTLGEIIDYVLENVGKADVGDARTLVMADIIDLVTVDLPAEVGGYLSQGHAELSVGYTASLAENGVYDLPTTLRTCTHVLGLIDDASLSSPARFTPFLPEYVLTDPEDFYYMHKWGAATSENPYGKPSYVLLYGNQLHLRPIPKEAGSPLWFGKVVLGGSVVQDFAGADENTEIDNARIVPALKAGATILAALRERRPDVASTWSEVFAKRKEELRRMMSSFARNPQMARDF